MTAKATTLLSIALAAACAARPARVPEGRLARAGAGRYGVERLPGERAPEDGAGRAARPKVTADFAQPVMTHDWWSSLIWQQGTSPHSEAMFPHPLSLRAVASGIEIGCTGAPVVDGQRYDYPHRADLVAGIAGLAAPDTRVAAYSDWTVTAAWDDGARALRATFGHGLPYVYFTSARGGPARVALGRGATVWRRSGAVAAVTVAGRSYALFAPPGATWRAEGDALEAELGARGFFSVAALPEATDAALAELAAHAFAFVRAGHVSWRYDRARAVLRARFEVETEPRDGGGGDTVLALYRHQWLHLDAGARAALAPYRYPSPRGEMKVVVGRAFEVAYRVGELLPCMPGGVGTGDAGDLGGFLKLATGGELFPPGAEGTRDSYWEGKSFGRLAELACIAAQTDHQDIRDRLMAAMKRELEDWFDGQPPRRYAYDATWRTLIGSPSMYGSDFQLNDHHFHYGYYVFAAALIAAHDRAWAARWAPMVELLIRDAGSWRRDDPLFPFLRHFDPYAGHSWASGGTSALSGNNEESSSEDLMFAAATAFWGEAMGRDDIRDAGLFLFATGTEAVSQYWYDADRAVFPRAFPHAAIGIVWGSGGLHGTWFSEQPAFIHGIQLTPMSAGALWLGRRPDVVARVLAEVRAENRGEPRLWRDLYWILDAFDDPARSVARLAREHYFEPEWGSSMALVYQSVHALDALGRVDTSVTADAPFYAAFTRNGKRAHAAYNGGPTPRLVRFSDGATLDVPPSTLAVSR